MGPSLDLGLDGMHHTKTTTIPATRPRARLKRERLSVRRDEWTAEHEWSPRWRCNERKSYRVNSHATGQLYRTRSYELIKRATIPNRQFLILKSRSLWSAGQILRHVSKASTDERRVSGRGWILKRQRGSCDNSLCRFTVNTVIDAHLSRVSILLIIIL